MVLTVLRYNFCLPKAGEVHGFREGLPHVVYTIVTSDRKKKKTKIEEKKASFNFGAREIKSTNRFFCMSIKGCFPIFVGFLSS